MRLAVIADENDPVVQSVKDYLRRYKDIDVVVVDPAAVMGCDLVFYPRMADPDTPATKVEIKVPVVYVRAMDVRDHPEVSDIRRAGFEICRYFDGNVKTIFDWEFTHDQNETDEVIAGWIRDGENMYCSKVLADLLLA